LEECIVNPNVKKDYTKIANKVQISLEQFSGMHRKEEISKASIKEKEPLVFQTNYLLKHVFLGSKEDEQNFVLKKDEFFFHEEETLLHIQPESAEHEAVLT
jgi:hypothetical protein